MDEPLKFTKAGNVPMTDLRRTQRWEKRGRVLMLHDEWFSASGELMSNDIHGYLLHPTLWQRICALFTRDRSAPLDGQAAQSHQGAV